MTSEVDFDLVKKLLSKMTRGQVKQSVEFLRRHPEVLSYKGSFVMSWVHTAVRLGHLELVDYLLGTGADINFAYGIERMTPLDSALFADTLPNRLDLVRALLDRGADPNVSRPLIAALNPRQGDESVSLELVRLLVEVGGADVNREYDIYGDQDNTFTALEFAEANGRPAVAAYLRSKGAVDRPTPAPPPPKRKRR